MSFNRAQTAAFVINTLQSLRRPPNKTALNILDADGQPLYKNPMNEFRINLVMTNLIKQASKLDIPEMQNLLGKLFVWKNIFELTQHHVHQDKWRGACHQLKQEYHKKIKSFYLEEKEPASRKIPKIKLSKSEYAIHKAYLNLNTWYNFPCCLTNSMNQFNKEFTVVKQDELPTEPIKRYQY